MFMTKLRSTKHNNRIWWIIVVVVLGFGLVGSYAVWTGGGSISSSNNVQPNANTKVDKKAEAEKSIVDQRNSIAQIVTRLKTAKDAQEIGSLNLALGNYHYDIGQVYTFQLQKDKEGAAEFKLAADAYKEAVKYDTKNADLRVDYATTAMYSSQNDLAKEQFEEAIKIDAKHLNAHFNYAVFLANALEKYPEALAQLTISKQIATDTKNKDYLDRIDQVTVAVEAAAKKPVTKDVYKK